MTKAAIAALLVVLAVFGVAWAARAAEGRKALLEADTASARGDSFDAIMAARTAAEAKCPLCTAPAEGFARLERIARDAEGRGDDATAFAAWGATRAALLATAGASTTSDRRTLAETEIARFGKKLDAASVVAGAPPTAAANDDKLRAALAEHDVPGGATFATIAAGAVLFFWAAVRFVTAKAARRADLVAAAAGIAIAIAGAAAF